SRNAPPLPGSLGGRQHRCHHLKPIDSAPILPILYRNIKKVKNQYNLVLSQNKVPPPRYN
ncbi:MAG: hypothetical protein Q7V36_08330, partial [Deltaproteobacteria bacterium]|nr:hypothetical protein [Deltaproteobacteria bacterium]